MRPGWRTLRRPTLYPATALLLLAALFTAPARAAAPALLTGDNNIEPNFCQGAFAGAWAVASITSKVAPPTPTGQAIKLGADTSAYLANINLKLCAPAITAPPVVKKHPPEGSCSAKFTQPITRGEYDNWNGIQKSYLFDSVKAAAGLGPRPGANSAVPRSSTSTQAPMCACSTRSRTPGRRTTPGYPIPMAT